MLPPLDFHSCLCYRSCGTNSETVSSVLVSQEANTLQNNLELLNKPRFGHGWTLMVHQKWTLGMVADPLILPTLGRRLCQFGPMSQYL